MKYIYLTFIRTVQIKLTFNIKKSVKHLKNLFFEKKLVFCSNKSY